MRIARTLIFIIAGILAISAGPIAINEAQLGQPLFDAQPYRRLTDNPDSARVDVIVEVAYDMLQFTREGDTFRASIEATVSISTKNGIQITRQVKTKDNSILNYHQTNSRSDFMTVDFQFYLSPGEYNAKILLLDRESLRRETLDKQFIVTPQDSQFDLSSLILSRINTVDSRSRNVASPVVSGTDPDSSGQLFLFFDIWRDSPQTVTIAKLTLLDSEGKERYTDSLSIVGGGNLSTYSIPINCGDLTFGRYELVLRAFSGSKQLVRQTTIYMNSFGIPSTIRNLEQAIQQLRYVATNEEIQRLMRVFPSEREKAFIDFWNNNFPTDGESINGKMQEYYNRINYTNQYFGNSRAGWETDRGRIYVTYGAPSEIERNDSNTSGTLYEIWYYNSLGKRFVFMDEYGFGNYRLVTPMW